MYNDVNWLAVNRTVGRLVDSLLTNGSEIKVASFILDRTLLWKRLKQKISIDEFVNGDMNKNSCGTGLCRSRVYDTIKRLLSVNIIFKYKVKGDIYYGVNCVPFIEVYIEGLKKLNKFDQAQKMIQVRDKLVEAYNKDPDLEIKPIPGLSIKDALRAARKVSVDRAEKKAEKVEHTSSSVVQLYSATYLWQKIKKISKEQHKLFMSPDYLETDKDRVIYASCMKRWMKECYERKIDMDAVLSYLIEYWSSIMRHLDSLDKYVADPGFNFMDFYEYREWLYDWVDCAKSYKERGEEDRIWGINLYDTANYVYDITGKSVIDYDDESNHRQRVSGYDNVGKGDFKWATE